MNKHTDPFWRTNTKNTDKLYKLSESTEAKKKSTSESVLSADWLQLTQKPPSLFVALELKKLRHRTSLKTSGSMFLSGFEADDILHRVRCIYIYVTGGHLLHSLKIGAEDHILLMDLCFGQVVFMPLFTLTSHLKVGGHP